MRETRRGTEERGRGERGEGEGEEEEPPLSVAEKGPVKHGSGIPLSILFRLSFFPLLSFFFFFICDWDVSRLSLSVGKVRG